jgi:hypothetical protein
MKSINKTELSIEILVQKAKEFCIQESNFHNSELFGITDGKAVGTYVEHKFKNFLLDKYNFQLGSSANGIDFPSENINSDMKVTSIKQPQSSCPFKNAEQKIFGLGYNVLLFVYDKKDYEESRTSKLNFVFCSFIEKDRTADYQTTLNINQLINNNAIKEEIIAYLIDKNLPADETTLNNIADKILSNPPEQGYLANSNILQWRLQYGRIVNYNNVDDVII